MSVPDFGKHSDLSYTHVLNESTHAALRQATTTENLYSIAGGVLSTSGAVHFEERDLAERCGVVDE
jgi:hypothetical protein